MNTLIKSKSHSSAPKYKVLREDSDCFFVVNKLGRELAECTTRRYANILAANPTTKPLDLDAVNQILTDQMGWELIDVAAFFDAATTLGYIKA